MGTYIGVDLGTSGVKAVWTDANGAILGEASASYPVNYPRSGWSEQDPELWFAATMRALKQLGAHGVAGLAVGGQMHGLVALDGRGEVIRPCILWNDGRTAAQTEYLNTLPVAEHTGNIAFAGFTAPKILWLKEHEPQNFARISKIMLPKDYLVYRLSGAFSTDCSDASGTLLFDVQNRRWSPQMLDICGICEGQLPAVHESFAPVGRILPQICAELGWGEVVVAAGAGDNAAAAIGTGTVHPGDCNISLGTSGTLFISSDKFALPANSALHSFAHANGAWHLMGCILSAAGANKWWIEDILGANYGIAEGARPLMGKNSVFFMPYLMGERCPHNDVSLRGGFLGLAADTSREQMSLSVLEGVAFALRDCLGLVRGCGIEVRSATVCGGGARSQLWLDILSNVLGLELYTVEAEQGPAYGAALLAMTAAGEYADVRLAAEKIVKRRPAASPNGALAAAYDGRYAKFAALYPLLKEWYRAGD